MKVENAKTMQDEKLKLSNMVFFFFFSHCSTESKIFAECYKNTFIRYIHNFIFDRLVFCNFTNLNYSIPFAPFGSHTLYILIWLPRK